MILDQETLGIDWEERNAQKIYWRMCKIKGQKQVNEAWERNLKIVGIIEYEDGSYWIVQKPREYP